MLSSEKWWGVISNYNLRIFPIQLIVMCAGVALTLYLIFRPGKAANALIKGYMGICNVWIGLVFFIILGRDFPTPLRQVQGALYILVGLLFLVDIFTRKTEFHFPGKRTVRIVTLIMLLTVLLYPAVGLILGRSYDQLIFPGTLPCATSAFALVLLTTWVRRPNKLIYVLLLVWAILFPPLIQLPKYHVYEDTIMFLIGLYALVVLFVKLTGSKELRTLKKHKKIFDMKSDTVFATASIDRVPNIVPIHSKHLIPGNRVLITDQFMNKTKSNIISNPLGTLSIKCEDRLFIIRGSCKYRTSGLLYNIAVRGAEKYAKNNATNKRIKIKCKGIILMDVENVDICAIG